MVMSFFMQNIFSLIYSHFFFTFVSIALGGISTKISTRLMSVRLLCLFSSMIFMVSGLTFRSLVFVVQLQLNPWDLMDSSMPGFPVLHHLLELSQTHVCWVSDYIDPSHLMSSPSPPAFIFLSIRVFSNDSALHIRWQEY